MDRKYGNQEENCDLESRVMRTSDANETVSTAHGKHEQIMGGRKNV